VLCKSLSASDVSDSEWIKKKFTVTNLPHCSSNVAIRHNDTTRHCDGDVTLRRDFAMSRHNRQCCSHCAKYSSEEYGEEETATSKRISYGIKASGQLGVLAKNE
jgi:hypothetical protein